jgi:hypothetical protein
METDRREFLQKISGAAFVAAAPSILGRDGRGRIEETLGPDCVFG